MAQINLYKTYSFKTKDPVIDALRTIIQDAGASYKEISDGTNVSEACLLGWFTGATRRPQHATVKAVASFMDYDYDLVKRTRKASNIVVFKPRADMTGKVTKLFPGKKAARRK